MRFVRRILHVIWYEFGHPAWDQYLLRVLLAALLVFVVVFSLLTFLEWVL